MARWRTPWVGALAAAMLSLALGACGGSGSRGGVGASCDDNDDCQEGLFCGRDGTCYDPNVGDADADADADADTDADGDGDADADGDAGGCVDADGDGHHAVSASCPEGDDCDDDDPLINRGAAEACGDGADNDCDGRVDEEPCRCVTGDVEPCYTGGDGTLGVGPCHSGLAVCDGEGAWGECLGEQVPTAADETACDGRDEDCDGAPDDGLANACGGCGAAPEEACGDSVDNDCDGAVDEGCACDPDCLCDTAGCECRPPTNQPCYEGLPGTMSYGICHGGLHDCADLGGAWGWTSCRGQQLPEAECAGGVADGLDNDCDGAVDEGCLPDGDGDGFSPPVDCDDADAAINPAAPEACNDADDDCDGVVDEGVRNACGVCGGPVGEEQCGNSVDDNCDGSVDEGCSCTAGETRPCYGGPPGTEDVGTCHGATQTCTGTAEFASWGCCCAQVLPGLEVCNGEDDDCDGEIDERWAAGSNACGWCVFDELCDGLDNDCDGLTDEGLRNRCGDCLPVADETVCDGVDNDCDGLVDEGLVNACGLCPPAPCYTDSWTTEDEWGEGAFDGTSTQPDNPLHEDCELPDTVCLDSSAAALGHIWIANAADHEVVRLNVDTGAVEVEVPSLGRTPSRTAVDTRDGSVWVANRAYGSGENPDDGEQSNVVHFASDGTLICRLPLPGMVRALAIDADYDIWAGLWNYQQIVHIDGETCTEIERQNIFCSPYGAAVDAYGNAWFACNGNWASSYDANVQSLVQVDVTNIASSTRHVPPAGFGCYNLYGLAVDSAGRAWVGSYNCGSIYRYDPMSDTWARVDPGGNMRGVAVAADGYVYVSDSSANRRVIRIEPETMTWETISLGGAVNDTVGAALDYAGRVWVVSRGSGNASRIDVSAWPAYSVEHFSTNGADPYTYSDMTGMQHLLHTSPTGTWTVAFDSGYALARWAEATWVDLEPAGTDVFVRARTAPSEAELATATWSNAYTTSAADLSTDPLMANPNRWIQIEVTLSTTDPRVTPVLYELHVTWEH